ncbi:hypothetical protein [Aeromonas phage phiA014S]|uniref:Uncharacterized protein n=1 Tax=Aeromonas phage phiA014S TaxID=3119845 RepID=A0ABZ2CMA6_9CAUD
MTTINKAAPQHHTGATVVTPDGFAMQARINRLKRELKHNRALMARVRWDLTERAF